MSEEVVAEEMLEVEITKISVNPYQPRRHFGKEELEELADSIKAVGLIQPPVVRWNEKRSCYELISGERRFRAAQLAGLTKISVIVRDKKDDFSAEAALIENVQRVDLNPMEIARALQDLKQFGLTQEDLAARVGKRRSTIANYLRLLDLPSTIQQKIERNEISMGHAKAILSLESGEARKRLGDLITCEHLSVRDAEKKAAQADNKPQYLPSLEKKTDVHLDHAAKMLQQKLGTKVSIQGSAERGRLCIDYYGLEDLQRVLDLIGIDIL